MPELDRSIPDRSHPRDVRRAAGPNHRPRENEKDARNFGLCTALWESLLAENSLQFGERIAIEIVDISFFQGRAQANGAIACGTCRQIASNCAFCRSVKKAASQALESRVQSFLISGLHISAPPDKASRRWTTSTMSIIASSNFTRKLRIFLRPKVRIGALLFRGEMTREQCARFQAHGLRTNVILVDPGFQNIASRRQRSKAIDAFHVGLSKKRGVQNENRPAHRAVDFTVQRHDAGFIERDHAGLFFLA